MKIKPWVLMYGGAFACSLLCIGLVYLITVTNNVSYESFIYLLMFTALGFAAGGYILESRYKKEHPEEYEYDAPVEE